MLFEKRCAECHGTYGDEPTYPNKVVKLKDIGTDPKRAENIGPKFAAAYNASWFAGEKGVDPIATNGGYQAPPLDGVWATAPYFHNGSVPTLAAVLDSKARPKAFTRNFKHRRSRLRQGRRGVEDRRTRSRRTRRRSAFERRKVYDTTRPGRGNGGHTYGDDLTAAERAAVVEYLKTL